MSEPNGPFATEDEALADAREGIDADADDDTALEIIQCAECSTERVVPSAETLRGAGWTVKDSGLDSQSAVCVKCQQEGDR